jgi:hypothetical protein
MSLYIIQQPLLIIIIVGAFDFTVQHLTEVDIVPDTEMSLRFLYYIYATKIFVDYLGHISLHQQQHPAESTE